MILLLLGLALSRAGVGDPQDGSPSWAERDVQLWSNAARLAPTAFADDYARGGCDVRDFLPKERLPVGALRWSFPLARVARLHSQDMAAQEHFSHDSSDGTPMVDRIQAAYGADKAFAENLARGYLTARPAVLEGWMCSDGHRKNLMDGRWDEAGAGVVDTWITHDLGQGGATPHPINMAVHEPRDPAGRVAILADVYDVGWAAPDGVHAVVDGAILPMTLFVGEPGAGIWRAETDGDGRCTPYYVEAWWGDQVVRWPEQGSYAWGRCDFDDPGAAWLDLQLEDGEGPFDTEPWTPTEEPEETDTDEPEVDAVPWTNLCSSLGGGAVALPLIVLVGGVTRRRRISRRALAPQRP